MRISVAVVLLVSSFGCQRDRELVMDATASVSSMEIKASGRVQWEEAARCIYFVEVSCLQPQMPALCETPGEGKRLSPCPRCDGGIVAVCGGKLTSIRSIKGEATGPKSLRIDERCAVWSVVVDERGAEIQRRQLEKAPADCDETPHLKGRLNLAGR